MKKQTALPELTQAPRLNLMPTTSDHFEDLHTLFKDPETMHFMPTPPHEDAEVTLQHLQQEMSLPGAQYWTIFLKNGSEPIGLINMLGDTNVPGMGYLIKRNYWGQGLAAEACRQVITYQFENTGIDQIELWINEDNHASIRVAEKLGFKLKGHLLQKYSYEMNHHVMLVYGIWKEEWSGKKHIHGLARINKVEPVLISKDIEESIRFYTETLGFQLEFTYGNPVNHAAVSWGDWSGSKVTLQLSQAEPDCETVPYAQLYFFTDAQIEGLFESFKANDVEIVSEIKDFPWGMREFAIRDPQGPLLRFGTQL